LIIALIAGMILTITTRARSDARDGKRRADLDTIKTAVEMYYAKYGTYKIYKTLPTTANPNGELAGNTADSFGYGYFSWFNCNRGVDYASVSVGEALRQWGYLNPVPIASGFNISDTSDGPEDVCNNSYGAGEDDFVEYIYFTDGNQYSIYTKLENPNYNPSKDQACDYVGDTTCVCHWDEKSSSGMCPHDAIGSYIARWSNYRVGNGQ